MPIDSLAATAERLRSAGCDAHVVGAEAREIAAGRAVARALLSTDASPELLLARFPRGVVIATAPFALALPCETPPLLLAPRAPGTPLEAVLREALYRVEALALSLPAREWLDPLGGLRDWSAGRLAAAAAAARFDAAPLAGLRAARLCAEHALEPDAALRALLRQSKPPLERAAPGALRSEVARLLLGPAAARGLALLREIGVEEELVPGARADAAAVVALLPRELPLRLLAWLRGTRAGHALRRLQIPVVQAGRLEQLLRFHPIELANTERPAAALRLLRRLGDEAVDWLVALREAELAASGGSDAAAPRLRRARAGIAQAREQRDASRVALAIRGSDVIALLRCAPGPEVGRALRFLAERVDSDPALNQRERLLGLLREWSQAPGRAARSELAGRAESGRSSGS